MISKCPLARLCKQTLWRKHPRIKLGLQARLFLIATLILFLDLGFGGALLARTLRAQEDRRKQAELVSLVHIAVRSSVLLSADASPMDSQQLAVALGTIVQAHVTIADESGIVLGDSNSAEQTPSEVGEHATSPSLPEVTASHDGEVIVARACSNSVKQETVCAAVGFQHAGRRCVLRLHQTGDHANVVSSHLCSILAFAALNALALALLLGFVTARIAARTIGDLFSVARSLVRVDQEHLDRASTGDEIGGLAESICQMARTHREAVDSLAQERDRFSAVLEGMGEAVVALDGDGRVSLCNRAALALLEWSESPVGKTLLEAVRLPDLHDLARRASKSGKAVQDVEVETRSGNRLLARATKLAGSDGGVVLVLGNVTELRRLEIMRRDFVANVSHELRTPVSTIRATAEALVEGAVGDIEHSMRFSRAILRNSERLSRIVADLLDLSRIEAGEHAIDTQPVGIASSAYRALEIVAEVASKRGLSVQVDVDDGLTAQADEAALDHVILNLLDNAVKYTTEGGHVLVWARRIEDTVRIEVRDTGPGVAERHRERIFERFYRVDTGRSRDLGGTGLGLSIVRHLMDAMGGASGFLPNEPHGAVFWLNLRSIDRE